MSNGGDIAATVRRLEQDVWHGDNRKPGLVTRTQQAEDRLDAGDKRMSAHEDVDKDVQAALSGYATASAGYNGSLYGQIAPVS